MEKATKSFKLTDEEMQAALWKVHFKLECDQEAAAYGSPRYHAITEALNGIWEAIKVYDPSAI
jgi:hypothetical protein